MAADEIYNRIFAETEDRFRQSDGCHDFDHTLRVIANAMRLCDAMPDADRETVRFAALLHDIARAEETGRASDHALRGAEETPEILRAAGMRDEEQIRRIADAVRTHRFRDDASPATPEARIVFDADKLDSLGAVGIGRAFLFAGKSGARLHNRKSEALASPEYSREDTAYREYLVKLRKLPGMVYTAAARAEALKRAKFMEQFFEMLNLETGMKEENP